MWFLIFVKRKRSVEDIHKQDRVQCIQTQGKHNQIYTYQRNGDEGVRTY